MPGKDESQGDIPLRAWAWSLGALVLGLLLSLAAAWVHHRYLARAQHLQHQRAAERSFEAVEAQLRVSGLLVRSVQALFLASDGVNQAEFASYYASLQPRDLFPSLQAIAYARKSERDGRVQFLTTMVAPMQGNERVLGLDVASQPANLQGLLASRDSDQPTLSAPFALAQRRGLRAAEDGVVIRLPSYLAGPPPSSVAERRARFNGSVAISFRVGSMIQNALPAEVRDDTDVRVTDVSAMPAKLLFESHARTQDAKDAGAFRDRFRRDLHFGGRTWRIEQVAYPSSENVLWAPTITLVAGSLAAVLLALLAWSTATTRERAMVIARRMSARYAESEARLRELNEMLAHQASHDPLTGLYNRREFGARLDRAIAVADAGGAHSALLYFDLDQFKVINDTSGHQAGDALLVQLAAMLGSHMQEGGTIARLGGDEFGILLSPATREHAIEFAEKMRLQVDGFTFSAERRAYPVSVSVGLVMIDRPGLSQREVLSLADTACYMAKERGRNRVHLYSEDDADTSLRRSELDWASRLRQALLEGRFLLYYQELHPLGGGDGGGHVELLLRLRDEEGKLVPPGAFIPAAERFGLMPQLDRWVVDQAFANFERLHRSGRPLQLCAINLSALTVEDDGFADFVIERLHRHGIAPARVCFELTETAAVGSMVRALALITRLRSIGCRFALDDFGAGMSSFGYLKNLPVDYLKIDGSFIRHLQTDPVSRSIVRAVTDIGHQLGLAVVAEWVADEGVVEVLRGFGVDYGQGYHLHAPEPAGPFA